MWLIGGFWAVICTALLTGSVARGNVGDPTTCPGYKASNIRNDGSIMTADLTLDGHGCDLYDEDLTNLKLLVEYQTGKSLDNPSSSTLFVILSYDSAR
jgi:alpha-glucosidase